MTLLFYEKIRPTTRTAIFEAVVSGRRQLYSYDCAQYHDVKGSGYKKEGLVHDRSDGVYLNV